MRSSTIPELNLIFFKQNSFATFMEHICVDHIEPTWKSKDLFVVNELHSVFALDALSSSHKISIEVSNPDQINEIFDSISYSKGASIIRSMDNFLTRAVFQQGLSNYLIKFSYQSANQNDLWDMLTDEARKSGVFDEKMSVKVCFQCLCCSMMRKHAFKNLNVCLTT